MTHRRWSRLLWSALTLLAACAHPGTAQAYTCTESATATAFGSYVPSALTATDSSGTITVNCGINVTALTANYSLALSACGSASYAQRLLSSGGNTLKYQLYRDVARTLVWGDGTASTSTVTGSVLLSVLVPVLASHTVYGRITALQASAYAGSYSDSITVTLTY